jgi:hypothetical protein
MEENQIAQLLIEVWDDVQKPAIFWQIGVLAVCLLIAGLISRQVKAMLRRRASAEPGSVRDVGEEGCAGWSSRSRRCCWWRWPG